MKERDRLGSWVWIGLLLTSQTAVAWGQVLPATAEVSGVVLDPSKSSVAGAKVTLHAGSDEALRSTFTDATGTFRFDRLAPGKYEVRVEHEGFRTARVPVAVRPRSAAPLRILLSIAELQTEVTVGTQGNQVSVEPAGNLDVVTLDRRILDELPVFGQDVVGTISRFLDPGSVGSGGVTLLVDGMETSERGVSASAIQEVRINQNPYSAEFSRPGRGRVEIITKAGSPEYHGTFNFLFRDHHLNARNAFAATRPVEQRRIFEGHLTGPLGDGKKGSFLISVNREEEDRQALVYALTPLGEVRENIPQPMGLTQTSARINRQLNAKNTLSFRYEFTDESSQNQGIGGFNLREVASNSSNREHHIYVTHRTIFSSRLIHEFFLRGGTHYSPTVSLQSGPRIVVPDAFTAGGAQADRLSTENHVQFNEAVSWSVGGHFVKFGMNVPDYSRRGSSDRTNTAGTFYFSGLRDYLEGRPYSFIQQSGEGHLAFWEKVMGWYVQDDIKLRPNLSLGLGARYDWQAYFPDHNNVSPRLSIVYAPGKQRNTVIRVGTGVFYDRTGSGLTGDLLRLDGRRLRRIVISNPGYPDPFLPGQSVGTQPTSIVRLGAGAHMPYTWQYSLGLEQQVRKGTTVAVTYNSSRGVSLFRSRDVNAPPPPLRHVRPDPAYAVIREIESASRLESHSLDLALRGNVTRFFSGMVQYTLGRAYNNTGGMGWFPADNYDLTGEWARADFDQRHRFNLLGTVRPGKFFQLGVALSLNSGGPYSLTTGRDDNRDGVAGDRPAGVRRNNLQGPGYANLDLRWSRDFVLVKEKKDRGPVLTVGLDAFNVLNRVNFGNFVGNLSSPFFGQPVSARQPRQLQVSLRFKF